MQYPLQLLQWVGGLLLSFQASKEGYYWNLKLWPAPEQISRAKFEGYKLKCVHLLELCLIKGVLQGTIGTKIPSSPWVNFEDQVWGINAWKQMIFLVKLSRCGRINFCNELSFLLHGNMCKVSRNITTVMINPPKHIIFNIFHCHFCLPCCLSVKGFCKKEPAKE